MRFRVLACDYDRTIALNAVVPDANRRALREVAATGRRLVLVTGRTMTELLDVFDELRLFDRIVLENGAVVHDPARGADRLLAPPVSAALVAELERLRMQPLAVGRALCATAAQNERQLMAVLGDLRLDLKLSYNRDSVMVLPAGISKATGFNAALGELGEAPPSTVAVGDGENDLPLLAAAGVGVAVENAVEALKQQADLTLTQAGTEGFRRLCTSLVTHDLADLLEVSPARA